MSAHRVTEVKLKSTQSLDDDLHTRDIIIEDKQGGRLTITLFADDPKFLEVK